MLKEGKVNVVIGGQAGSEAKGKLSAYLARHEDVELVTMAASPNAGHTYVDDSGKKWVSYHMPAAGKPCLARGGRVALGPTSVINPITFVDEIKELGLEHHIKEGKITIDPRATIITPECIADECEGSYSDIGSTTQGVGAARCRKAARGHAGYVQFASSNLILRKFGVLFAPSRGVIDRFIMSNAVVLHEMSQGFDLDLEYGIDSRYCTSKMINTSMGLAEIGVPPSYCGEVIGVIRPYPIRVSNRTGYSGGYAEGKEISWQEIRERSRYPEYENDGVTVVPFGEITTTTKLPRRVFEFSPSRYKEFVRVCGPTRICLQFANYLDHAVYGWADWKRVMGNEKVDEFVQKLRELGGPPIWFIGTGPMNHQMCVPYK